MSEEIWELEADLLTVGITEVLFDYQRHLVCRPYSIPNLHQMAKTLGIKRGWFHRNHYDIPKKRVQDFHDAAGEDGFFRRVSSREILKVIKEAR